MTDLNKLLFQEGELARRKRQSIQWPELMFLAEALREPMADIQVVTLRSHIEDDLTQRLLTKSPNILNLNEPKAKRVVDDNLKLNLSNVVAREFIQIFEDRVLIGVNFDEIDEEAIERALSLLGTVEDFSVGQKFEFGSAVFFESKVDETSEIL